MPTPVTINIPHQLGQAEVRRRLELGFAGAGAQLKGLPAMIMGFQQRWEGDRLHFEAGGLGQTLTGRLDVLPESVRIEIDLPPLLVAFAERVKAIFQTATQKLLSKT
jgi:hypothetical protein